MHGVHAAGFLHVPLLPLPVAEHLLAARRELPIALKPPHVRTLLALPHTHHYLPHHVAQDMTLRLTALIISRMMQVSVQINRKVYLAHPAKKGGEGCRACNRL